MAIRLSDLDKPLEPVVLPSGREVAVVPVNGAVAQMRADYNASSDPALLWQIAAELLPDATPEEIRKLSVAHCAAVIAIAAGNAEALLSEIAEEAETRKKSEGNRKASDPSRKVRRRRTGSAT